MEVLIPEAIGPYATYRRYHDLIFVSGQLPIDPATGKLVIGNIYDQACQSLKNTEAILSQEGCHLDDILKVTVYLTDLANFAELNRAFTDVLGKPFPARTAVEISKLPMDGQIEIETIAAAH
ncbi:Rid family detoxifying hydrolase [Loigolactobacillus coryniformis]|uniref:Rid family detoxifying hydrolase n=1 Tax=Loigolactobacillus coryniformis TaxID=1610 RepID=UPI001C5EC49D|nr:Rid family detoxifying hydrolase [Loigolactobacillus coryniformis]MBW4801754.1 Rid family detoxifying hydrolase [Loigolactobacillus coryniformis subsp. torquens]MBW4804454.1 Rid family detoxifying hydrolase [Loigolactobacillus coryniformis subsp. torquens]